MEIEAVATNHGLTVSRSPPAWVKGMAVLPFGVVLGFMWTAMPFLLTRQGVPLGAVAKISATVVLPLVWAFLCKPFLDSGLMRSTYCLILTATASVSLAVGVMMLTPAHLGIAVPALAVATFSMVLYTGSSNGWTSQVTGDHERGSVGGWQNVANLGGGALGSYVIMSLLQHALVSQRSAGLLMGALVWLGATPLLFFPKPLPPQFRIHEVFTKTLAAIWRAVQRRECLVGFALLLSPAAGTAAGGLQSGLGPDFHTSETTVVWVTGIASAIACSIGALLGGKLADMFPRGYVYLFSGLGTALTAIATAALPRTATVFIVTTLVYNVMVGGIYASYNALGLELTGASPVASTQLGLFAAAINMNVNYMTRADGIGYHRAGATGLFLVDGLASIVCIVPLLFLVRAERSRKARFAVQHPVHAG
jgi:MFS transporter, PAT family, beta-lactamase induction signal transducer AmpG